MTAEPVMVMKAFKIGTHASIGLKTKAVEFKIGQEVYVDRARTKVLIRRPRFYLVFKYDRCIVEKVNEHCVFLSLM